MRRYVIVWLVLLALTAATYGAARVDLGAFNTLVALAIATTKTLLVVAFFMHLWDHPASYRLVLATSFLFVFVLMAFTVADVKTRFAPATPHDRFFEVSRQPAR